MFQEGKSGRIWAEEYRQMHRSGSGNRDFVLAAFRERLVANTTIYQYCLTQNTLYWVMSRLKIDCNGCSVDKSDSFMHNSGASSQRISDTNDGGGVGAPGELSSNQTFHFSTSLEHIYRL